MKLFLLYHPPTWSSVLPSDEENIYWGLKFLVLESPMKELVTKGISLLVKQERPQRLKLGRVSTSADSHSHPQFPRVSVVWKLTMEWKATK